MSLLKHVYKLADGSKKETNDWYYRFSFKGKLYFASTRTPTRELAEKIEREFRDQLVDSKLHPLYDLYSVEVIDPLFKRKIISRAKGSAKEKGYEFNLTPDDILLPSHCPALGIKLDYSKDAPNHAFNLPSLDRIDSTKGYIRGNVAVVSHRANRLKNNASAQEIENLAVYVKKIKRYLAN